MSDLNAFPDPRTFEATRGDAAEWHALAATALDGATATVRDAADRTLHDALRAALDADAAVVERAIEDAPSPEIARHVWRSVETLWRSATPDESGSGAVVIAPFALPVVVIAGVSSNPDPAELAGVLSDIDAVAEILRNGGALQPSRNFGLSNALVSARSLAIAQWPAWTRLRSAPDHAFAAASDLAPVPIRIVPGAESAHLRFLVGGALSGAGAQVLGERTVGAWGRPLATELARQLAEPGATVLALPRVPQTPFAARHTGLVSQREVSAQLFASNALRRLRQASGEPTAVISAHRAEEAPGGGELRLSLSSPFDERDAEGFRCPLYPIEPVTTPLRMLLDLLEDCRVRDVRLVAGVHPDRVPGAPMPLLFRPDAIPDDALLRTTR